MTQFKLMAENFAQLYKLLNFTNRAVQNVNKAFVYIAEQQS
jgi:hypothetical protein